MRSDNINGVFTFHRFSLNPVARTLHRDGKEMSLGGRAFDLLFALVQRHGEIVSRRDLMAVAWSGLIVEDSNVRVQISHLRRELGCAVDGNKYITSVAGRGYCFVAPVRWQDSLEHEADPGQAREGLYPHPPPTLSLEVDHDPGRDTKTSDGIFGREQNLEELTEIVSERRVVTLVGPGGIGKTTLATMVRQSATAFDQSYFVDLSTVVDNDLVLDVVLEAIFQRPITSDVIQDTLALLSKEKSLVVLDNCEHVMDGVAATVESLLKNPSTHILNTSIEPLRVSGEAVYLLKALPTPPNTGVLTARQAMTWPSVELFMHRASDGGYSEELSDDHAASVASICRRLDGNPLAIGLVAGRVGFYGLDGVASLLDNHAALRWRGGRNAVARHQTFEALLDWSYALLSPASQIVLQRLSVMLGDFTFEDAAAVAACDRMDRSELADAISDLIDKAMLSPAPGSVRVGQLRLREAVRIYAGIKLAASGNAECTRLRHARYYAGMLKTRAEVVGSGSAAEIHVREQELLNVRAALEWAFSETGDRCVGAEICAVSTSLFLGLSRFEEYLKWCKLAVSELPEALHNTGIHLTLLESLAISAHFGGNSDSDFVSSVERGLELSRELKSFDKELHFLAAYQLFKMKFGDFKFAMQAAESYENQAELTGGPTELAIARWMRGTVFHLTGNQAEAEIAYREGFDLAASDKRNGLGYFENIHRTMAKISRARVAWLRGSPDRALLLAEEAIEEARGNPPSLCQSLLIGITIFLFSGELDRAEILTDELLALTKHEALSGFEKSALAMRGQLLVMRGEAEESVKLLRSKLESVRSVKFQTIIYSTLRALAEGLSLSGEHAEALSVIDTALGLSDRGGGTYLLPELLRTKAQVIIAAPHPNFPVADRLLSDGIRVARESSAVAWELRLRLSQIELNRLRGSIDTPESVIAISGLVNRFQDGFDSADLLSANSFIGTQSRQSLAG